MRQILGRVQNSDSAPNLSVDSSHVAAGKTICHEKRSDSYLMVLRQLDVGSMTPASLDKAIAEIAESFPFQSLPPIGLVAPCYLGHPYEVHIVDLAGGIIEHFEFRRPMPKSFERARKLACHGEYVAVEVYENVLVCIREDGTTTEVKR